MEEVKKELADEEIDTSGMPLGWTKCPKISEPVYRLIPMKTPLGPEFDKFITDTSDRFSVKDAVYLVQKMLHSKKIPVPAHMGMVDTLGHEIPPGTPVEIPAHCNLVIDLTNSKRYYRIDNWRDLGIRHVKIPNRGRGEAPAPQAVNDFVYEVATYLQNNPAGYVMVHCTHGFNRTGYMIVSYLMRMLADQKTTLEQTLFHFARVRPPGIYKNYYIEQLFRYYHQKPLGELPKVPLPDWKLGDSPDHDDEETDVFVPPGAEGLHLQHDDVIGEAVSPSEASWVIFQLQAYLMGATEFKPGLFPGSQPVSLSRKNSSLLMERRYWVTWKADGTRYLLLIHRAGTYLIDRSNRVTRVQMRWPAPLPVDPNTKQPIKDPKIVPTFHSGAILDGEMVVDEIPGSNIKVRRFMIFDLMALNGESLVNCPFGVRWDLIDKYIEKPRRLEADAISRGKLNIGYQYNEEPFRVRRKGFWPLEKAKSLLDNFIPKQVAHESDGLIFQPYDDAYVPLTCRELLKWKFAHLNSVDFKLKLERNKDMKANGESIQVTPVLQLLKPLKRGMWHIEDVEKLFPPGSGNQGSTPPSKIIFPGIESLDVLENQIIECSWDNENKAWKFMRERRDKVMPNADHVCLKVWDSIQDDIKEPELLHLINKSMSAEKQRIGHA